MERRILALRNDGMPVPEIARRFGRSPAHIERVIRWTDLPRSGNRRMRAPSAMARRVLHLRAAGESHDEIGRRFRRSGRFIRQVEGLAHYTRAIDLLATRS
jgi:hypothetical protein